MAMNLLVKGERVKAAILNRPMVNALTASGYAADGSDFVGWLPMNGGSLSGPVTQTTAQSGATNAFTINFNHTGGAVGFQLGHALFLSVNFTPAAGTNRGLQAQKVTGTLFGTSFASGTGIDGAALACVDISGIIDASRSGTAGLVVGLSSAVSKWNNVDDTPASGAIIAGQFTANLNLGTTSVLGLQVSTNISVSTTASSMYGLQVFQPVLAAGSSVTQRGAAVYIDDWSSATATAAGATLTGGYAVYAVGGHVQMAAKGQGELFIGDGPGIATAPLRAMHVEFANDAVAPSIFLKSNTSTGFSYFEHQNNANALGGFFFYGDGRLDSSPTTTISRASLMEFFHTNGSMLFSALSLGGATANLHFWAASTRRLTLYGAPAGASAAIEANGDLDIVDNTKGLVLRSPNSTRYRVTATNVGALTLTAL